MSSFAPAPRTEPGSGRILLYLAGFVLVWTLYAAIIEAPVSLKHDMAEAYAWGRQFQWGYNQHPPFWAWICGAWFRLLPRQIWAFAALSSLNAGIGLWGAWVAMGEFAADPRREAGLLLLLLTPLYTFYAYKYDANTIFLSVWPWMLVAFLRLMRRMRVRDGVAFGIATACAILSKYYAAVLIATCALAWVQMPNRFRLFARPAPWVAMAVTLVLIAPHLWWLTWSGAPPLRYLASIEGWPWPWVLAHAANAPASALGMWAGPILLAGFVWWRGRATPVMAGLDPAIRPGARTPAPGRDVSGRDMRGWMAGSSPAMTKGAGMTGGGVPGIAVIATLTFAPLLLSELGALVERTTLTSEMLLGTFPLAPLLLLAPLGPEALARLRRLARRLALAVSLGALAAAPVTMLWRTWLSPGAMKVQPYQEVARVATKIWHQRTGAPLRYVAGTHWYENEIAFYSSDRPHAFKAFHYAEALWVTPARLARDGLLSVCVASDARCLRRTARFVTPGTTRTEVTLARRFLGHVARPVRFVITVIPPARSARRGPG